jgi:hypothetical protein
MIIYALKLSLITHSPKQNRIQIYLHIPILFFKKKRRVTKVNKPKMKVPTRAVTLKILRLQYEIKHHKT